MFSVSIAVVIIIIIIIIIVVVYVVVVDGVCKTVLTFSVLQEQRKLK